MERADTSQSSHRPRRRSAFTEVGLLDEDATLTAILTSEPPPRRPNSSLQIRPRSATDGFGRTKEDDGEREGIGEQTTQPETTPDHLSITRAAHPARHLSQLDVPLPPTSRLFRLGILALLLVITLPIFQRSKLWGKPTYTAFGAGAVVIPHESSIEPRLSVAAGRVTRRDDSPTSYCKRWSHQSAVVNGTLYIFGGRMTSNSHQTSNTWNNDFLTMDLKNSWQISSPAMKGLPQPSGPPAVANGFLWNSRASIFLYGGEFSDNPPASPVPYSLWEYDIRSSQWIEHSNPKTSSGTNAEEGGVSVGRSAEGSGVNVPFQGRGYYFGGHQDGYTTDGWSQSIERIYLKSLLEFTFPGASNDAVKGLSGSLAGPDGAWRNISQGGVQDNSGFPERADGILVYIPGFGDQGILLGLAGGDNTTFTQMNVIDVYDIAASTWYKQTTSGNIPDMRVNPCAVVAAAADGSSYNVYMFGGQNLQPAGDQTQKNDMWILSVPSFTWLEVSQGGQTPYGRSGHTCNIWDGQMIVTGGYVGSDLSCESPGIYVFNLSSLSWGNQFVSLSGDQSQSSDSDQPSDRYNPFSQQISQRGSNSSSGLEGSYGYSVPDALISVIGGKATGGATLTAPVATATGGPLATGKAITYTVTGANGAIITQTGTPGSSTLGSQTAGSSGGKNVAVIVVGVIAGILFIIAAYFAFCAWIYRKQLLLYKRHTEMAQRHSADPSRAEKEGFIFPQSSQTSSYHRGGSTAGSSGPSGTRMSGGDTIGSNSGGLLGRTAGPSGSLRSSSSSMNSTEDLLAGQEPTFWGRGGVLLNPRRSLRVVNRD